MPARSIILAIATIALAVAPAARADHAPTWVVPDDFAVPTRSGPGPDARRPAVDRWMGVALGLVKSHETNPPRASRVLAHVGVAMNDAVATLEHSISSPARGDREAAAAAAAWRVLADLYPDRAGLLAARGARATRDAVTARTIGRVVATRVIARANADGSDARFEGGGPRGPGHWEPTPPGFVESPAEPAAGRWRTWNIADRAAVRPPPPPAYFSWRFEREMREVYETALSLTDDQRRIALFWADGPGTFTPPGHWTQIGRQLIRRARMPARQAARAFALLGTAQADAFIACWDAKYTYWSVRPVTAIRDRIDPDFLPFITTPPFPGYVSGHATISGAASTVLAELFPRASGRLRAMAEEAAVSRLYGGIHFASDNDMGLALGRQVGRLAVAAGRAG